VLCFDLDQVRFMVSAESPQNHGGSVPHIHRASLPVCIIQLVHTSAQERLLILANFADRSYWNKSLAARRRPAVLNKTVEIDESKFGRRKYYRRHALKG